MKNKKLSILLIIPIFILIFLIYLVLESFDKVEPVVTNMVQDKYEFVIQQISKYKKQPVESNNNEHILSYEDTQKFSKIFPDVNYKGRIYYNIYGKTVFDDETFLNLSDVQIDENLSNNLSLLTNIKEIDLYGQSLSKDDKILLQETYPNIKFKWYVDVLGENIDSSIEALNLSNKHVSDLEDFKKSLKLLTNLKTLDMSYTNLSNEQLADLRVLFPNTKISWVIHMSKWSLRTDAVAFSVLVYKYDYRRMITQDIQVLKYCTDLQALDLGHQAIQDISVIGEYLPNLRVLILADNQIKDISPLANLKHLNYLELFMNDITDATPLASCKELVDLNISFNYRFSDISGILDLPLLERLWLISDRISPDSYNLIRQRYPNVQLVTTGSGSTNSGWRTHERYYAMIDMFRKNYISEKFLIYDNKP